MAFLDTSWTTIRPAEGFYTSEVATPERWPVRTFLPTGYEPRYPYPLIVFLHDPRQAIIRATLDAVNRRIERMLHG